jgi:hypothetical protein
MRVMDRNLPKIVFLANCVKFAGPACVFFVLVLRSFTDCGFTEGPPTAETGCGFRKRVQDGSKSIGRSVPYSTAPTSGSLLP